MPKAPKTAASKAASPKKPKLSTGKATKPELKPLDEHLAALLNPALNREREAEAGHDGRTLQPPAARGGRDHVPVPVHHV